MIGFRLLLITILLLAIAAGQTMAQDSLGFSQQSNLTVSHAAIDPSTGDILIVSNTWRNVRPNLRRFHPDGESDSDFILQRWETCCAIHPVLVTVDPQGNIYTLEYTGELGGFYIYKHAPTGELDIDWGQREGMVESLYPISSIRDITEDEEPDEDEEENGGGFEEGETVLDWNAGGGRMHFALSDPIDLVARADGSLLVLDRVQRYVYLVSPDGQRIAELIGREGYYPIRPQRLLADADGYMYLIDNYDGYDLNRGNMIGVFRFEPDGTWQFGWGAGINGVNDPWRPTLDITTLVVDGSGNLLGLGGEGFDLNHSEVFVFDRDTGIQVDRDTVQFRMGHDEHYLGIVARPDSGFVILEELGFTILVNYYTTGGTRERQIRIDDLYQAE